MANNKAAKAALLAFHKVAQAHLSEADAAFERRSVPLHYQLADVVSALMRWAKNEGLDWKAIQSDAKEGVKA